MPMVAELGTAHTQAAGRVVWHAHAGYELLLMREGATTYEFHDGRSLELAGGHLLLVPPQSRHRGAHDVRMPSVMCGIAFNPSARNACHNTPFARDDLAALKSLLRRLPATVRPFTRDLRHLVARLMEACQEYHAGRRDAFAKAQLRGLACLALVEAARQLALPAPGDPAALAAVAADYLQKHFAEVVRMSDLARHLGLSRARMFAVFKQASGLSPNDYLTRYRVQQAAGRLRGTRQSVTEIALGCGFSSSQYFSHVFRKYANTSPGEFRRKGAGKP